MNRPALAVVALFSVVFAYSVYDFFETHERKEITEYTPFKGEARENPLFAARLFLKEMGIPAENKNDLQSIGENYPDTNSVIILDTRRTTLSQKRTELLLAWVREGGHLITPSSDNWTIKTYLDSLNNDSDDDNKDKDDDNNEDHQSEDHQENILEEFIEDECPEDDDECLMGEAFDYQTSDHLQKILEVTTGRSVYIASKEEDEASNTKEDDESNEKDKKKASSDSKDLEKSEDSENKTEYEFSDNKEDIDYDVLSFWNTKDTRVFPVALSNASKKLNLSINPHFYSMRSKETNESHILIDDEIFLLQRAVGKGMVTLTADIAILENQLLRETDNAEFLWYLVHSNHQKPNSVWLFHNDEMPSLFSLMWRHGWAVILSLIALLLFWLYQSIHRFGPLIPKQEMARRRLMEHIEASGQYFWKKKNKQTLIDSTRLALNQRIARLHPAWDNADEQGKVDHLAEMLELPHKHIKHLLFDNRINTDEDFTKLIIELEKIRKHL
ncbi:MAG TPA: hypothetical protein ENI84_01150 [Thiothrix sp.]|nr:hypothetical protein [Thiothrix sp.]